MKYHSDDASFGLGVARRRRIEGRRAKLVAREVGGEAAGGGEGREEVGGERSSESGRRRRR